MKHLSQPSPQGEGFFVMMNRKQNKNKDTSPSLRGEGRGEWNKLALHAGAEPHQFKHARELRRELTKAEKVLWEYLRARRFLNLKFRRQHPILDFIADFYCHELRLIVEADGGYHKETDAQYYDKERTKELRRYGFMVVRFSNEEILNDVEGVLRKLSKLVYRLRKTSFQTPLPMERGFCSHKTNSQHKPKQSTEITPSPRGEGRGEVEYGGHNS